METTSTGSGNLADLSSDRAKTKSTAVSLPSAHFFALTVRALEDRKGSLAKLAKDQRSEGYERDARNVEADIAAIETVILPQFRMQRELPVVDGEKFEKAVGDALAGIVRKAFTGLDDPKAKPLFAQTGSLTTALVSPWVVSLSQSSKEPASRVRSATDPAPAQTTCDDMAVAGIDPFLYVARQNVKAKSLTDPIPATVASANQVGIVSSQPTFMPFLTTARTNSNGQPLDGVVPSMTTGQHHAIVQPAAIVRLIGDRPVYPLDKPSAAQTTGADQNMIVSPSPFLIQYYGTGTASGVDEAVPGISTRDRHGLVSPGIDVNDCYFRMFAVPEVQATMAFPGAYKVLGTKGKRIKQLGNAVTPPAMSHLIQRVTQYLTGARRIRVRVA